MKKYGVGGALALIAIALALIAGPVAAMVQQWTKGDVMMAEVVVGTYGPIPIEEPSVVLGIRGEEDGGETQPPSLVTLPCDVMEKVLQSVAGQGSGKPTIIYATTIDRGYNLLIKVEMTDRLPSEGRIEAQGVIEGLQFFEVVVAGNRVEISEIIPQLVKQHSEVIKDEEIEGVEDERVVARVISYLSGTLWMLELQASGQSTSWFRAGTVVEGRNIVGIALWRLRARGDFLITPSHTVHRVINRSYAWANSLLFWSVDWFSRDTVLHPDGHYGEVSADAGFDGILQSVTHGHGFTSAVVSDLSTIMIGGLIRSVQRPLIAEIYEAVPSG